MLGCVGLILLIVGISICGAIYYLWQKADAEIVADTDDQTSVVEDNDDSEDAVTGRVYYLKGRDIVSRDVKGEDQRVIVEDVEQDVSFVQTSPNGKYLVYRVDKGVDSSLHLVDLETLDKKEIDATQRMEGGDSLGGILLSEYPFSPNSKKIAYSKNNQIWMSDVEGSVAKVYDLPLTMSTVMVYNPMPQWLDDATVIFIRKGEEMGEAGFSGIAISAKNITGGASIPDIVKVGDDPDETDIRYFLITPDKTKIVYNAGVPDSMTGSQVKYNYFYTVNNDGEDRELVLQAEDESVKSFDLSFTYYAQAVGRHYMIYNLDTELEAVGQIFDVFADWGDTGQAIIYDQEKLYLVNLESADMMLIDEGRLPAAFGVL